MAKEGKRERHRASKEPLPVSDLDAHLFGGGLTVSDYRLSEGVICFKGSDERWFDLIIDDERLFVAIRERLTALGVSSAAPE